jgi:hypothetical protein
MGKFKVTGTLVWSGTRIVEAESEEEAWDEFMSGYGEHARTDAEWLSDESSIRPVDGKFAVMAEYKDGSKAIEDNEVYETREAAEQYIRIVNRQWKRIAGDKPSTTKLTVVALDNFPNINEVL